MTNYEGLEKLAKLKNQWIISNEEFEIEKKKILNNHKLIDYNNNNDNSKTIFNILFSHKWKIWRGEFIGYSLLIFFLYIIAIICITLLLDYINISQIKILESDDYLWIIYLPFFYSTVILTIKRFHDLNRSWWDYLLFFIPIYNLYLSFILIFSKWETESTN